MNLAILKGNVTNDSELKFTPSGTAVMSFGLATNKKWKDKSGNMQEQAQFHRCQMWGKAAESLSQYITKGKQLLAQGEIQYRSWDKEDGTKGYATDINLSNIEFCGSPNGAQNSNSATGGSANKTEGSATEQAGGNSFTSDDIPFFRSELELI